MTYRLISSPINNPIQLSQSIRNKKNFTYSLIVHKSSKTMKAGTVTMS